MTIRHSDTVNPMPQKPSPAIVRRVSVLAVRAARLAWTKAHESPSEATLRHAYRSCVLASRALRKAAAVTPRDAKEILEQAERIDVTAEELKASLASL